MGAGRQLGAGASHPDRSLVNLGIFRGESQLQVLRSWVGGALDGGVLSPSFSLLKKKQTELVQWLTPVIPALW